MIYDLLCLLMVILAFTGGFQKGVVRIFSILIAISLAAILTIWCTPYFKDFMLASFKELPKYTMSAFLGILFFLLCWLLSSVVSKLWRPLPKKKQSTLQNVAGGLILSLIMVVSIAILSGFFEQTKIISSETKQSSIAYKIMTPIHEGSRQLWINLTNNTRILKDQTEETSFEG